MIDFNEADPYPLLSLESYSYQDAKDHALLVDDWLGFECDIAEDAIRSGSKDASGAQQNWSHISVQAMQTPYVEIRGILDILNPQKGESLVDLGAAYGRIGFVMAKHYPDTQFYGFELERARVIEAHRVMKQHQIHSPILVAADLCSTGFTLPVADYYFVFDFGHEYDVRKALEDLKNISRARSIQVVARGRLSRALIHQDHPWLSSVNEPRHFPHFSIYRS